MTGKVAIVTGAARGIGLATTKHLLSEDISVVMVDWDSDELKTASHGLNNVLPLDLDVSNPEQVDRIVEEVLAAWE